MMRSLILKTAAAGVICVSAGLAWRALAQSPAGGGDAKRGAVIAAQGTAANAPPCAQCHAYNGVSDGTGAFPRIAGLPANYAEAQLRDFASGVRQNAIMSPIAKDLTPAEMDDVAEYYANLKAPFLPLKSTSSALVKLGEQLATVGDAAKGIPACDACHGPQGNGQLGIAPYLGGQYAHYIAFTLRMWQEGYRKNSPDVMETFAKKLERHQIEAVAAYYQQVAAPGAATAKE